ncbi:glutamate receptor [Micractinium conductrix]|uniref:Glutamate receptor n=1 Tax=Micractinium conductrix TaxID=554055 RepID=A0A2P6VBW0_9CHLO|nr:glutamate receptor [Micractinium conductrix]|eukprot:PSC71582.1 glutamate receptor [Micractinium conductrix]
MASALAAALLIAASVLLQPAAALGDNGTVINVCTSEATPNVYCLGREPQDYGGYEIELFRAVAAELGWQESQLRWRCLEWEEMLGHLRDADGVCDIAAAGIDITFASVVEGLVFTWPTARNGLAILTIPEEAPTYVPFIVYAIDCLAYGGRWPKGNWPKGVGEDDVKVVTVYAFLIVILFALYIGACWTPRSKSDCGLVVSGSTFETYQQATAFPSDFNDTELLNAYNAALVNLTASGVVAGLWILQAGAVGVGLVLVLLHIFHVRFTRPVLGQTLTKARCVVSGAPSGKPMAPAA